MSVIKSFRLALSTVCLLAPPSPPSLQYSHSQNRIMSLPPPTVHLSIYYLNTGYKFPLPPTKLTFNWQERTDYHHKNSSVLWVVYKNGWVMRIKITVFGIWDAAYKRIYSVKYPASGAGEVSWCHMSGECVWSRVRVDQYISAVRAVEVSVFVYLRSSCNHVTGLGGNRKVCETRTEVCHAKWRGLCGWNYATLLYRNLLSPWQHVAEDSSGYLLVSCKCTARRGAGPRNWILLVLR